MKGKGEKNLPSLKMIINYCYIISKPFNLKGGKATKIKLFQE